MDQVRRILATIGGALGKLAPSQKLLIASLAVIVVMTLFVVSQYAAAPKMVPVLSGGTSEDAQRIAGYLETQGIEYKAVGGKILVPAERQYAVLAQLTRGNALPADKKLLFSTMQDSQDWIRSRSQLDQRYTIALSNELAQVIRNFPGVTDASVFIAPAPHGGGIGAAARKPTAQITVFTRQGSALDQPSVDALADLVAGSVAGLEAADVKIVDGTNRRRYRANQPNDFAASTYLEQAAKVEERIQNKIVEHLSPFIPNVIVSVNAIVDASRKESRTESVLPKGEGTQSLLSSESTSNTTTSDHAGAAEPGIAANTGLDLNRSGAGGRSTSSTETSETKYENLPGRKTVMQVDPTGKPLKINVAVSVPKDYVSQILASRATGGAAAAPAAGAAPAAPSDDEINKAWEEERPKIESVLKPLIETEVSMSAAVAGGGGGAAASAGSLVVTLIPVAMSLPGGAGAGGGGAGSLFGGGVAGGGGILGGPLVKQVALGGLAALSLGLMLLMVKKASRAQTMPTAEELVGIPPALQPNSDLVGEAEETDAAMTGIEVGDEELKTGKMLEQVSELVKSNPSTAAKVFNRWVTPES